MFFCCCLLKKTMSSYFKCAARVVKQNNPCWLWISEAVKVLPRVTRQVSTQRKLLSGETWVMDWFSCNTGHNWRDIKWPGLDAVSSGGLLELQQANAEWINWFDLYLWPTAQIIKSKLHGCTAFFFSPPPPKSYFLARARKKEAGFLPSTQDGAALVVPATCPGKQEHLTVCDRSSILFLLQHRCAAITSQVPAFTWTGSTKSNIC